MNWYQVMESVWDLSPKGFWSGIIETREISLPHRFKLVKETVLKIKLIPILKMWRNRKCEFDLNLKVFPGGIIFPIGEV
jgi:hypothetical protein